MPSFPSHSADTAGRFITFLGCCEAARGMGSVVRDWGEVQCLFSFFLSFFLFFVPASSEHDYCTQTDWTLEVF